MCSLDIAVYALLQQGQTGNFRRCWQTASKIPGGDRCGSLAFQVLGQLSAERSAKLSPNAEANSRLAAVASQISVAAGCYHVSCEPTRREGILNRLI